MAWQVQTRNGLGQAARPEDLTALTGGMAIITFLGLVLADFRGNGHFSAQNDVSLVKSGLSPTVRDAPPMKRDAPPTTGGAPPAKRDAPPTVGGAPPTKRDAPPAIGDAPPKRRDAPPIKRDAPLLAFGGTKRAFDGSCLPEQATFLKNAAPHGQNLSALYHFKGVGTRTVSPQADA